ncbi:lysophospholipid acyltransferase family protein [Desulfovibrio litoralis]|uniref:Predicted acyltransferase, LPLAT superfamily n=1 Tax=Desulfovibrio litoralis DSM 11393 TaxID=1121455 RepID=A0A1M7STQ7_9BACT|nr:lysophospholipid acyltransferase family protein [Desulfovibrio litoralis]SHN61895.1 Predicted acyltransferase, LPLAT superfamily [Desulfovibrio litoralis DSM 11393]
MSKRWSSKSLGSRFQHAVFYYSIAWGGWFLAYCLLYCVVFWYSLFPNIQRRSYPYLKRRFPNVGSFTLWTHTLRLYLTFGKILVDRARAGILKYCEVKGTKNDEEKLKAIIAEGNGVILLSAHIGCWQLALTSLSLLSKTPAHIVMYQDNEDNDKHYHEHSGTTSPFSVINPQDGITGSLEMFTALNKGHIVGFLGDRLFGSIKHTIKAKLLNGDILIPKTPFMLAATTGAPIVVWFAHRTGIGQGEIHISKVLRIPKGAGRNLQEKFAQDYVALLEVEIQKYPYQFFNFFNIWELP